MDELTNEERDLLLLCDGPLYHPVMKIVRPIIARVGARARAAGYHEGLSAAASVAMMGGPDDLKAKAWKEISERYTTPGVTP
jgi:hypothetical protein